MKNRSSYRNDRGVVMMETLLTLPVYALMLAGVFWLGEAGMTRLALTNAEQLRIWESGIRYGIAPVSDFDPLRGIFRFLPNTLNRNNAVVVSGVGGSSSAVLRVNVTGAANTWGQIKGGHSSISLRRSLWSWGIASVLQDKVRVDGSTLLVHARVNNAGTVLNNYNLSRQAGTTRDRNDSGFYNNNIWQTIYASTWQENPGASAFIAPATSGSPNRLAAYTRDDILNEWSW